MFRKEDEPMFNLTNNPSDRAETIIGPSVKVEGDFSAMGDVIIEGIVSGSFKTEKNLKIGPNAKIYADISAESAVVAGEVQGDIKTKENLELAGTARVFGDIKTKTIVIAQGAILIGRCIAGEDKRAKPEKVERKKEIKIEALTKKIALS